MPLELGLAIAWQKLNPDKHVWFVFEAKARRIEKSMSDLNGTDTYIHRSRPIGIFGELANAFSRQPHQAGIGHMEQVFRQLQNALPRLCRNAGTKSPSKARVFGDLRVLALALSEEYVA